MDFMNEVVLTNINTLLFFSENKTYISILHLNFVIFSVRIFFGESSISDFFHSKFTMGK